MNSGKSACSDDIINSTTITNTTPSDSSTIPTNDNNKFIENDNNNNNSNLQRTPNESDRQNKKKEKMKMKKIKKKNIECPQLIFNNSANAMNEWIALSFCCCHIVCTIQSIQEHPDNEHYILYCNIGMYVIILDNRLFFVLYLHILS